MARCAREQDELTDADHASGRLPRTGSRPSPATIICRLSGPKGGAQGRLCAPLAAPNDRRGTPMAFYFIFRESGTGPDLPGQQCRSVAPRIQKPPHPRPPGSRFTHDCFFIRDEVLGPMVMRVATFFPFQTTYYLNGHNFIEQELNRAQVGFRKNDNAFLAIDDVAGTPGRCRQTEPRHHSQTARLLDPDPRAEVLRQGAQPGEAVAFYAISQIEYCRNFIFKRRLSHPQTVRAWLRARTVAADSPQDYRDLRRPPTPQAARQAPPSSIRSSMAITSSAPTSSMPS